MTRDSRLAARGSIAVHGTLLLLLVAAPALAHPVPFSYLDVHLQSRAVEGTVILHDFDVAHDLAVENPDALLDAAALRLHGASLGRLISERLTLVLDGTVRPLAITAMRPLADRSAIEISWRTSTAAPPGHVGVNAALFPYDPNHQTFVNIYEGDRLVRQYILNDRRPSLEYYAGNRQGAFAVFKAFTASGVHHIAIGPDHVLFIVGLLLLGGSVLRLLGIVSAFTIGHSITLSLAALGVLTPPARLVEPAIALSIVYVGADNLLAAGGRDVRPWIALFFGLVHGFGFAGVLREIGLPPRALGVSLFSFNLGVEIGQAVIVIIVASLLAFVRMRSPSLARQLVTAGSVAVIIAGAYWFIQRIA